MFAARRRQAFAFMIVLLLVSVGRAQAAGWEPTWGVRISSPQIVSASFGVLVGQIERPANAGNRSHLPHGLLIQVEPGLGGGKASLGYAMGLLPYAAGGVKASVLRTWGHPLLTEPGRTYVGVEAEASFFIKLSLGVMARVAGPSGGRVLVTGGVGLAFWREVNSCAASCGGLPPPNPRTRTGCFRREQTAGPRSRRPAAPGRSRRR